jgi:two-component system sensor histidine kinase AgrC
MTLSSVLGIFNYETVLLFGVLVSVSFAGVENSRKNRLGVFLLCITATMLQFFIYAVYGKDFAAKLYPFIIHIPLILFLRFYCKRPLLMSSAAVLAAYLCCQTRRWLGSIFLYFFESQTLWYAAQILVTPPLLYLLIHYVAKPVYRLMQQARRYQILFGLIPFFYYIFDYTTTVYSNLLYEGYHVAVEFMPSVMSVAYFCFVVVFAGEIQRRSKANEEQRLLVMQVNQAAKELSGLRQSQTQAAIYRHDLRHHLRYLEICIREGKSNDALTYIQNISQAIDASQVVRYCENETVNLILSSYAAIAGESGIRFDAKVTLGADDYKNTPSVDLCVILGNILENAILACESVTGEKYISIETRRQNSRVFWHVRNPYKGEIHFDGKLPITEETGHGMGVKSVAMTVEKLHGLCEFTAESGVFTVRLMV